jgi:transposase
MRKKLLTKSVLVQIPRWISESGLSRRDVAAISNGAAFATGRDFAAWLGLVPKQMSTVDRTILGRITKRGNRYLRTLFVQGARVIVLGPANWAKHSFEPWLTPQQNACITTFWRPP